MISPLVGSSSKYADHIIFGLASGRAREGTPAVVPSYGVHWSAAAAGCTVTIDDASDPAGMLTVAGYDGFPNVVDICEHRRVLS